MPKVDVNGLMKKFRKAARIQFDKDDMRIFAEIVRDVRRRAFQNSVAPDGSQWEKLKPETIARKRKKGAKRPEKPLIDKGYLEMPTIETKTNEATVRIAKSREEIGPYHNKGGGNLPKREHWAIYPEAEKQIDRMKEAIFERKVREIFG